MKVNSKYLYKKQFKLNQRGTMYLTNPELIQEYNNEKAELLYNNHLNNKEQLKIKQDIINEFKEIYEYDLKNADIPEPFGLFVSEEEKNQLKEKKLFNYDFYMTIGNIFAGYIENLARNGIEPYDIDIPITIINYKELYDLGVYNLFSAIKSEIQMVNLKGPRFENIMPIYGTHAYFASYVFPTLIEYFLGIRLRSKLLYECIDKLKILNENKTINFSKREKELYNIFFIKGNKIVQGNERNTMKELYNMFVKYKVLEEKKDYEMILVGDAKDKYGKKTRTIGGIICSPYANKVIVPECMDLIKWLFEHKYLNIRNNIMHGNNINFDYFGICFPCIMLELIWDIGREDVFI